MFTEYMLIRLVETAQPQSTAGKHSNANDYKQQANTVTTEAPLPNAFLSSIQLTIHFIKSRAISLAAHAGSASRPTIIRERVRQSAEPGQRDRELLHAQGTTHGAPDRLAQWHEQKMLDL